MTLHQNARPPFLYPICLDVSDRTCIVVGGGVVAERKAAVLVVAGARVVVIAPDLVAGLRQWRGEGHLRHIARFYRSGDLLGAFLVIAATDDPAINHAVAAEARQRGVLVNVVDDPTHCDFSLPAVLRRGDLQIAVSTGGRSPAVAQHVRDELADFLRPVYADVLAVAARARAALLAAGECVPATSWRRALADPALREAVEQGDLETAQRVLLAALLPRAALSAETQCTVTSETTA